MPIAAFNNRYKSLLHRITYPVVAEQLANGKSYERATKSFVGSIKDPVTRAQIVSVYVDSIKTVWFVSMAFAALAFLLVILENQVPLRKYFDTKFRKE